MSGGGETAGGAVVDEMVGAVRNRPRVGRDQEGYEYGYGYGYGYGYRYEYRY